jgi:NhaP-type Na+/H+ or K+/H+ antiporter
LLVRGAGTGQLFTDILTASPGAAAASGLLVPVAISLIRSKVRPPTILFLGWFGPRGLASIQYLFAMLDTEGLPGTDLICNVVMITVLFSVLPTV